MSDFEDWHWRNVSDELSPIRRVKRFPFRPDILVELFRDDSVLYRVVDGRIEKLTFSGIPANAKVVGAYVNHCGDVELLLEHNSFPERYPPSTSPCPGRVKVVSEIVERVE